MSAHFHLLQGTFSGSGLAWLSRSVLARLDLSLLKPHEAVHVMLT